MIPNLVGVGQWILMLIASNRRPILLWGMGFLLICVNELVAQGVSQSGMLDSIRMKKELSLAISYLATNKLDSTFVISERLIEELKQLGQLDSPFGLRLQLVQGTALEHIEKDSMALELLLHVQEISKDKEEWETYAEASRVAASLYEKLEQAEPSIMQLRQVQWAIKRYGLDSIYSRFAIRISSWHRLFGDRDSALFYAEEVLRTAPQFGQLSELAVGHLLMGMLNYKNLEKKLAHFTATKNLYLELNDFNGLESIYNSLSYIHFDNNDFPLALAMSDSSLMMQAKVRKEGDKKIFGAHAKYWHRGNVFRAMEQHDSAWHYLQKGRDLHVEFINELKSEKIAEINAKYQDEKKTQRLKEQSQQIEQERKVRNGVLAFSFIIILLAVGLTYFYRRLRKAKQKTEEQSEQLKSLDMAKSRFFANVSHELRTPLTLLLSPIHTLLKDNQLSQKQNQLLQLATKGGQQLQRLVNEILDLRKLETGKMDLHEEPTELSSFFRQYASQFQSLADSQNIDFIVETLIDSRVVANIDREKNRQLILNLLSNAFKFTPKNGRICTSHVLKENQLQLEVADTGRGIHPNDLPHVFDRYYQSAQPNKVAEGGTGIGLALCNEYVQLFGGKMEVESILGKGSVFRAVFPITFAESPTSLATTDGKQKVAPLPTKRTDGLVSKPSNEQKPTVLVVEDNRDLRNYLRLILEAEYNVVTAENGKVALNRLGLLETAKQKGEVSENGSPLSNSHSSQTLKLSPSLIISDLMMPEMDGYQLLEALKSSDATRHIPIIMLTARAEAKDKLKALRIGVDDYLTKPFDEEELLVRIENLLDNQAVRKESVLAIEPETASPACPK